MFESMAAIRIKILKSLLLHEIKNLQILLARLALFETLDLLVFSASPVSTLIGEHIHPGHYISKAEAQIFHAS